MNREPNTTMIGQKWPNDLLKLVWEKGIIIPNYPQDLWRLDYCGGIMNFTEHGNTDSKYGWEIDHINPIANGGNDNFQNLQPLNWEVNRKKSDRLDFKCLV